MPKRITVLKGERSPGYTADEIVVTLRAGELAGRIGAKVAALHRDRIRAGQRPSGGPQRPLGPDERARAARGAREPERGMGGIGAFPASIGHRATGGDERAAVEVAADPFFDAWQRRESARGVEYFEGEGDVERVIDQIIEADLKESGWI